VPNWIIIYRLFLLRMLLEIFFPIGKSVEKFGESIAEEDGVISAQRETGNQCSQAGSGDIPLEVRVLFGFVIFFHEIKKDQRGGFGICGSPVPVLQFDSQRLRYRP